MCMQLESIFLDNFVIFRVESIQMESSCDSTSTTVLQRYVLDAHVITCARNVASLLSSIYLLFDWDRIHLSIVHDFLDN